MFNNQLFHHFANQGLYKLLIWQECPCGIAHVHALFHAFVREDSICMILMTPSATDNEEI